MQLPGPAGLLRTMTSTVRVRPPTLCVIVIVSCARAASTNENLPTAHFFVWQPAVGVRWSADQSNVIGGGTGVGGVGAIGIGATGGTGAGAGAGAVVVNVVETALLPPTPFTITVNVCVPTLRPSKVTLPEPQKTAALSMLQLVEVVAPEIANAIATEVLVDVVGGTEVSTTVGAGGVTVQLTVAELLPPGPLTVTTNVWSPTVKPVRSAPSGPHSVNAPSRMQFALVTTPEAT